MQDHQKFPGFLCKVPKQPDLDIHILLSIYSISTAKFIADHWIKENPKFKTLTPDDYYPLALSQVQFAISHGVGVIILSNKHKEHGAQEVIGFLNGVDYFRLLEYQNQNMIISPELKDKLSPQILEWMAMTSAFEKPFEKALIKGVPNPKPGRIWYGLKGGVHHAYMGNKLLKILVTIQLILMTHRTTYRFIAGVATHATTASYALQQTSTSTFITLDYAKFKWKGEYPWADNPGSIVLSVNPLPRGEPAVSRLGLRAEQNGLSVEEILRNWDAAMGSPPPSKL